MELQISYRICAKVSAESVLWGETQGSRRNFADAVQLEEGEYSRGRGMPGSRTYAGGNSAEGGGIELHGILEREEQLDDLRKVSGIAI